MSDKKQVETELDKAQEELKPSTVATLDRFYKERAIANKAIREGDYTKLFALSSDFFGKDKEQLEKQKTSLSSLK